MMTSKFSHQLFASKTFTYLTQAKQSQILFQTLIYIFYCRPPTVSPQLPPVIPKSQRLSQIFPLTLSYCGPLSTLISHFNYPHSHTPWHPSFPRWRPSQVARPSQPWPQRNGQPTTTTCQIPSGNGMKTPLICLPVISAELPMLRTMSTLTFFRLILR